MSPKMSSKFNHSQNWYYLVPWGDEIHYIAIKWFLQHNTFFFIFFAIFVLFVQHFKLIIILNFLGILMKGAALITPLLSKDFERKLHLEMVLIYRVLAKQCLTKVFPTSNYFIPNHGSGLLNIITRIQGTYHEFHTDAYFAIRNKMNHSSQLYKESYTHVAPSVHVLSDFLLQVLFLNG